MHIAKKNSYFLSLVILFILCTSLCICAYSLPLQPTSNKYVHDYVGILTPEEIQHISSLGSELEQKTGAQVVTVIIPSTSGQPIESYSLKLFRGWGIGQKEKDNGLLILVALQDRSWRVEVGRGLEGVIPDALSNRVMTTYSQPAFATGDYGQGIVASYSVFVDTIANEYHVSLTHSLNMASVSYSSYKSSRIWIILIVLVAADLILTRGRIFRSLWQIAFWSNIGRGPRGPRGGYGGGGGHGGFGGGSSNGGGSSGGW